MNYWTKQLGTSPDAVKAAKLMAALAAGDVTVFFSRHGTWTRDASNIVYFSMPGCNVSTNYFVLLVLLKQCLGRNINPEEHVPLER